MFLHAANDLTRGVRCNAAVSLTVDQDLSSERELGAEDQLERLSQLAGTVLKAAEQLALTATAVRGANPEPAVGASRGARSAALIAELLTHENLDGAWVARQAAELGCDLSLGALALCVELHVNRPDFVTALISEGCSDALIHVSDEILRPRVYAVLPTVGTCVAGSVGAIRGLARRLEPYGLAGVSSYQADAAQLGRALREAELILDVIRHSGAHVAEEVGSGTYRLLLRMLASHPEEMREFHSATIAPLLAYDRQNDTDLLVTLQAYLECDCNMNATATAVYAHRHTVASRLERIRLLTGLDPLHHEGRERLGLGLKAHRLLAPQLRD